MPRKHKRAQQTGVRTTMTDDVPGSFPSNRSGFCQSCGTNYRSGSLIARWGSSYGHADCVAAERARAAVMSGDTFRAHQPNPFRSR